MTCVTCNDIEIARQGRCPSCGVRFSQIWRGGHGMLRVYLGMNIGALLLITAAALFSGALQLGTWSRIVFPLMTAYTAYRVLKTIQAITTPPKTYRGAITDISLVRLSDMFTGSDQRLKIGDQRFKLDDDTLRRLQKGQEVMVQHTRGTNVITEMYAVTPLPDEEPPEPPRRHHRRARRQRR